MVSDKKFLTENTKTLGDQIREANSYAKEQRFEIDGLRKEIKESEKEVKSLKKQI